MFKKLYIVVFLLFSSVYFYAQSKAGERQEKIEQIKADFIKQKMGLSPSESQAFWPLYNDLQEKREALRKQREELWRKTKDPVEALSDKDLDAFIEHEVTYRQKEADLQKDFQKKLKLSLSSKKIAGYYLAEEEFRRKLAELIKQK